MVYFPLAHMVWGKGGLLNAALGGKFPTLDFAGGTVVHITSGVSALVCALYLGKRTGYPKQPMPPHSVVLSFIGACLLWVGWFGFNAGSALAASSSGDERVCGHAFRGGGGGAGMVRGGMAQERQAERAGRDFRRGGGTCGHHAGFGIRGPDAGAGDRVDRGRVLLLDGHKGEGHLRV